MTEEQQARLTRFLSGHTVLANIQTDRELIELVKREISPRAVVMIDRRGMWGNPFKMKEESERDLVCEQYQAHFDKSGLGVRVEDLRRKVLVCWCYPKRCHGLTFLKALGELNVEEKPEANPEKGK